MKKIYPIMAFAALMLCSAKARSATADYNVIPLPQKIEMHQGQGFVINSRTVIQFPKANQKLRRTAEFLSQYIEIATGVTLKLSDKPQRNNVIVLSATHPSSKSGAYKMSIDAHRVLIDGADQAGVFYGVQTLRKSIGVDAKGTQMLLPCATIEDYPRFGYRGAMLDVSRHTYPLEFIKKYIDLLALHNINYFHWHLTDDQGWRIEIKKYPRLVEMGSMRKQTLVGHYSAEPQSYDNTPYGGYFTQQQAKEIVAYAAERFITVIPEVDLPGHMLAALTAYPELGCTGGPYEVGQTWGVFDDVLCPGNDKTFEFLEGVYSELMAIFPSKYIHVGGDECPKVRWRSCPKCQARIAAEGMVADDDHSAEDRLQSYTIGRMAKFLGDNGRSIIGWDEILEGGLAKDATVMSWRGIKGGVAAAKLNHDVIMVPTSHLYFDYYQKEDRSAQPLAIGGYVPLEKVYGFEPIPAELTSTESKHILGLQANLWAEYILSPEHAEYMLLPRMDALAEVQWSEPERKNYDLFLERLVRMTKLYDKMGYNYAK